MKYTISIQEKRLEISDTKLEDLTKEELIEIIHELIGENSKIRVEKDAIVFTMNKFLCKDHPQQLHALLYNEGETGSIY